jgi:hypothetical protein
MARKLRDVLPGGHHAPSGLSRPRVQPERRRFFSLRRPLPFQPMSLGAREGPSNARPPRWSSTGVGVTGCVSAGANGLNADSRMPGHAPGHAGQRVDRATEIAAGRHRIAPEPSRRRTPAVHLWDRTAKLGDAAAEPANHAAAPARAPPAGRPTPLVERDAGRDAAALVHEAMLGRHAIRRRSGHTLTVVIGPREIVGAAPRSTCATAVACDAADAVQPAPAYGNAAPGVHQGEAVG